MQLRLPLSAYNRYTEPMSVAKVRHYLEQFDAGEHILEFMTSSETVELAALAVGCEPARIAKTLSFLLNDKPLLIVVAGDARIDNQKFKAQFSQKASMIPADEVERLVGFAPGGVCPFGVNEDVRVYLDRSLLRFASVYPACGSGNSAIELTPDELEQFSRPLGWIDVCRGWRDEPAG